MLAMLRTAKASPGCRPRVTDGHTRESEQANTMYCMHAPSNSEKQSTASWPVEYGMHVLFRFRYYKNQGKKLLLLYTLEKKQLSL